MASLVALLLTVAVAKGPLPAADAQTAETTTTIAPPTSSSIPPIAQPDTAAWLGDSFSAGEGVPPFLAGTDTLTNSCHRSTRAYGMRLTGRPGFPSKSVFVACSFAFIDNFYPGQGQWGEKGQLENLTAQHKLVALTVGGNDIGFVGWMALCIGSANCQLNDPLVRVLIANTQPRLAKLYGDIMRAAPRAHIYILGYPHAFARNVSLSCRAQGLQNLEARWFNAKVDELNGVIKNAIAQNASARLHYVDTTDAFLGGEACSPSHQFMNELMVNIDYSFHPTASGQLMLASKLAHAVRRT